MESRSLPDALAAAANARADGRTADDYHSFVSYRAFLAGADWARRQREYRAAHEWVDFDEVEAGWADWASDQDFIEEKMPRHRIESAIRSAGDYFTEPPAYRSNPLVNQVARPVRDIPQA